METIQQRSANNIRILYELFRKTAQFMDVDRILDHAQTILKDFMGIKGSAGYLLRPDGESMSLQSWQNLPLEYLEKSRVIKIGRAQAGPPAREDRLMNADSTTGFDVSLDPVAGNSGFGMQIDVPLMAGQVQLGVMRLFWGEKRILAADEIQLMEMIGGQLGILIQNARYVEAVNEELRQWVKTEQALIVAKKEAEAASKAKSDFLANMSHEIRTPINAITGLGHLLLQTEMSPKQDNYVRKIQSASRNLLGIINDILDFSKIESGNLVLESVPFNLEEVLTNLSNLMAEEASRKGIDLVFSVEPDVPLDLSGDALRLTQVLTNLTNNAVKFTQKGRIVLRVETLQEDCTPEGGVVTLRFSVRDTGIGLTQDQIDNLFRSFSQADSSITRKYGGTGLGLAISRQLIALMEGDIAVSSKVGEGSTFYFTARFGFRKRCGEAPGSRFRTVRIEEEEGAGETASLSGLRVLVAEDNSINRQVIQENLRRAGLQASVAVNGKEVVAAIEKNRYDAVLMDLQMPEMNGLEAARVIRSDPRHHSLPIIALTAHAVAGDRERCLAAGMNDYITKPIEPDQLFTVLRKWLKPSSPAPAGTADDGGAGWGQSDAARKALGRLKKLRRHIEQNEYIDAAVIDRLAGSSNPSPMESQPSWERLRRSLSAFDYENARSVIDDMMEALEATLEETPEGMDDDG